MIKIERIQPSGTQIDEVVSRIVLGDGLGLAQNPEGVVRLLSGAWLEMRTEGVVVDGADDQATKINEAIDYLDTLGGGALYHRGGTIIASQILLKAKVALIGSGYGSVIKQAPQQHTQVDSGTATGGNATRLFDTSQAWTEPEHIQRTVHITGGTGAGQARLIIYNTATELHLDDPWTTNPDATSTYEILDPKPLIGPSTPDGEDQTIIQGLYLDGDKANQTAQNPVVRWLHPLNPLDAGANEFDARHILSNCWLVRGGASGLWIGKGVREARVLNCMFNQNNRFGTEPEHEGGTDAWFINNTSFNSGMAGFWCGQYGARWVVCKAFGNGTRTGANGGPNEGFRVTGLGVVMGSCEAQENFGDGFKLLNTYNVSLSNCQSDANGQYGYRLNNAQDCHIQGIARSSPNLLYHMPFALKLEDGPSAGQETDRNEIHLQVVGAEMLNGVLDTASSVGNDNWIFINNRLYGRLFQIGRAGLGVAEEHFVWGKEGGSGPGTTGNPYYALKTDETAIPKGKIIGFADGTTKVFATLDFENSEVVLGDTGTGVNVRFGGTITFDPGVSFALTENDRSGDAIHIGADGLVAGQGIYTPGIAFSRLGLTGRRRAGIAAVQTGTDPDQVGIAFFTHETANGPDPLVEMARLDHQGVLRVQALVIDQNLANNNATMQLLESTNFGAQFHYDGSNNLLEVGTLDGAGMVRVFSVARGSETVAFDGFVTILNGSLNLRSGDGRALSVRTEWFTISTESGRPWLTWWAEYNGTDWVGTHPTLVPARIGQHDTLGSVLVQIADAAPGDGVTIAQWNRVAEFADTQIIFYKPILPDVNGAYNIGGAAARFDTIFAEVVDVIATFKLTPALGNAGFIEWYQDGVKHWTLNSEGNADDDISFARFNNSGVFVDIPFLIDRTSTNPIELMVGGSRKQVTQGAADSSRAGFRVLEVPN